MRNWKSVIGAVAVWAVSLSITPKANALFGIGDIVFDPAHTVETVAQLAVDIDNYVNQIEQLVIAIKNLENYDGSDWYEAEAALEELAEIAGLGESLAFSLPGIDEHFKEHFKGIEEYLEILAEAETVEEIAAVNMEALKKYSEVGRDSAAAALKVAATANAQVANEVEALDELREASQSAEGRLEAIQVGNAIAAEMIGQAQKVRTLLSAHVQLQAVQAQTAIDKEEREEATDEMIRKRFELSKEEIVEGDELSLGDL